MILSHEVWRLCENCVVEVWGSMFNPFPDNPIDFITLYTSFITFFSKVGERISVFIKYQVDSKFTKGNRVKLTLKNFIKAFIGLIVFAALTVLYFSSTNPQKNKKDESTLEKELFTTCKSPITSWPIKRSAKDRWLDEIDPKVSDYSAFFFNIWDAYDNVAVKHQEFPHSIGVRIPIEDQLKYRAKPVADQVPHSEYIEYSLGFEYETLQFDFGIDDISFPHGLAEHPKCQFKIIVDACDSESFYSSKQEHLYETDWLNDRCCLRRTPEMDVSGCEAVRITIKWQFFPRENGPIAFNIAIVNPILRAEKLRNHAISITKPDSIR